MVDLLKNNEKFTPFVFYNRLLKDIADNIQAGNTVAFKFVENGDEFQHYSL